MKRFKKQKQKNLPTETIGHSNPKINVWIEWQSASVYRLVFIDGKENDLNFFTFSP